MNIPTNLAVAFIQSADRNGQIGKGDDLVTAKEIARQARSYIDQRQKEVDKGNLEAAKGFEPSINFAASLFFGGPDHDGQVPDFNGDGMIGVDEILKLDRNKDGMITDEERDSVFGLQPGQGGSLITPADIESLKNMGDGGGGGFLGLFGGGGSDARFKSKKKASLDNPPPTAQPPVNASNPFASLGQGPAFLPMANGLPPLGGFAAGPAPATASGMDTVTQLLTMLLGGQMGQPTGQAQQSPVDMNQLLSILMMMA